MNYGQQPVTGDRVAIGARNAHYTLALLTVMYTLNYLDRNLFSIVLQSIKVDLQLTDTQLGLVGGMAFVMFYGPSQYLYECCFPYTVLSQYSYYLIFMQCISRLNIL